MDVTDRQSVSKALARTHGGDRDGWERVEEYQRVLEYAAEHPTQKSAAVSSALDLPRERIRSWVDGDGRPDPVRTIQTAEDHGWLDALPGERVFEALSVLHAWVYAGGSIAQLNFVPTFAVGGGDPRDLAAEALRAVGLDATIERADEPRRATEVRPAGRGRSHLGRYLHGVLGAPIGPKNERSVIEIPAWLSSVGASTRLRWARVYVVLRSTPIDEERHGYARLIKEERSQSFRGAFGDLLASLAPRDSVTVGQRGVLLRPDAARELNVVPSLP